MRLATLQVVSDAASVDSPSLPSLLRALYSVLAVLQFQGILLSPACTGGTPFQTELCTMGIALSPWIVTLLMYYGRRDAMSRLLGQFTLMFAMTLFPSTVLTSAGLLRCETLTLPALGAASLDGGPPVDLSSASARGGVVSLSVSAYNPFYVCWRGSATVPMVLAAAVIPIYVVGMPALSLWWLWRDPWVRFAMRKDGERKDPGAQQPVLDSFSGVNPLARQPSPVLPPKDSGSPTAQPDSPGVEPDPRLGVFFYDYKPTAWYTKHIDLALLLLMSLFRALLPRPTSLGIIAGKTTIISAALLAACVHVLWVRPYIEDNAWMVVVRAMLLVDSLGITLLNALVIASDAGLTDQPLSITSGGTVIISCCVCTLAVLVGSFIRQMWRDAKKEQAIIHARIQALASRGRRVAGRRRKSNAEGRDAADNVAQAEPSLMHEQSPYASVTIATLSTKRLSTSRRSMLGVSTSNQSRSRLPMRAPSQPLLIALDGDMLPGSRVQKQRQGSLSAVGFEARRVGKGGARSASTGVSR